MHLDFKNTMAKELIASTVLYNKAAGRQFKGLLTSSLGAQRPRLFQFTLDQSSTLVNKVLARIPGPASLGSSDATRALARW